MKKIFDSRTIDPTSGQSLLERRRTSNQAAETAKTVVSKFDSEYEDHKLPNNTKEKLKSFEQRRYDSYEPSAHVSPLETRRGSIANPIGNYNATSVRSQLNTIEPY